MQPSVSVKHIKYEAESCVWIVCESVSLYQLNAATTDISSDLLTSGLAPPMMTFLFMKSLLFWKLTGCFNVVSVSDFLSCLICSVLNCIVLRQPAKIEVLCVCCGCSRSLELRCSRDAAQPQSVEAHTLTEVKPEADRTGIWWNWGVNYQYSQFFQYFFYRNTSILFFWSLNLNNVTGHKHLSHSSW